MWFGLVDLVEYELGDDDRFNLALDIDMALDSPEVVAGRTMLHLVVCDDAALHRMENLPLSDPGSRVPTSGWSYCAMANRTVGDFCLSFPLEDTSPDDNVYHVHTTISESMRAHVGYKGVGPLHFLIDTCEVFGGANAVLRSCLNRPGSRINSAMNAPDGFYCPLNYPFTNASRAKEFENCTIPERASTDTISVRALVSLCNKKGQCLVSLFPAIYAVVASSWALSAALWILHVRKFPDMDLQTRMALVLLTQCASAAMTSLSLYTESRVFEKARTVVVVVTILAQLLAVVVSTDMLVLIAKGWQITRVSVRGCLHQSTRVVILAWATFASITTNSTLIPGLELLIPAIPMCGDLLIALFVWWHANASVDQLRREIVRLVVAEVNAWRMPVYLRYTLLRCVKYLVPVHAIVAFSVRIMSTDDDNEVGCAAAAEALRLLLFAALGYNFRCRRFEGMFVASVSPRITTTMIVATVNRSSVQASSGAHNPASIAPAPPQGAQRDRRSPHVVVVRNPDNSHLLGSFTGNQVAKPKRTAVTETTKS